MILVDLTMVKERGSTIEGKHTCFQNMYEYRISRFLLIALPIVTITKI
jgi:hypothetical protein